MIANHHHSADTQTGRAFLLGLILSWAAFRMSKIRPTGRFTYGLSAWNLIPGQSDPDQILAELGEGLHEQFEISHTTFQIESGSTPLPCLQTACDNQQRNS